MNKNVLLDSVNMVETVLKHVKVGDMTKLYDLYLTELKQLVNQVYSTSCDKYELEILKRIKITLISLRAIIMILSDECIINKNELSLLNDLVDNYNELYGTCYDFIISNNA